MPAITMEMALMSREQKAELAKTVTEAASKATGIPEAGFYVFIHENPLDNVGVGGTLLSDR